MRKNNFYIISAIAVVAVIAIVGIVNPSLASYGATPRSGQQASTPADLPDQVKEAIKNKLDFVEIPVSPELSRIYWIDYASPIHLGTGTDCGPDSDSYKRWRNLKWFSSDFPVRYQIDASGVTGVDQATAKQAVVNAFNTWDAEEHPAGAFFTEASPSKINVNWGNLDGAGGTLAVTSVTYNVRTGRINRASVTYDSGDPWAVYPSLSCNSQGSAFDIEDVGAHEIGHVIGLAHVGSANDIALTLYPYASLGETLKRTLGTGDKKGIDAIY